MREVAIIGIGQTPVEEHWDKSLRELRTDAILQALGDAQQDRVDGIFVGNMMSGILRRQEILARSLRAGLRGVEAFKVESACGSGAAAIHLGVMAIASGYMDSVIVMGAEKMTETSMAETTAMAALSLDTRDFAERDHGPRFAWDGEICPTGRIPIATRGGLKARVHPVEATGVYQIAEIVQQLRGEAGKNQIPDVRVGMAQNI